MKNKKILKVVCICIFLLLSGCNKQSYERDTTPGEVITITLEELVTKMQQKESFTVMLTQELCLYCQDFHAVLEAYQKNHHVIMYEVILDQEDRSPKENLAIIQPYFPDFSSTPGIFYVKDGKAESQLDGDPVHGISEEMLETWVKEYQLDQAN